MEAWAQRSCEQFTLAFKLRPMQYTRNFKSLWILGQQNFEICVIAHTLIKKPWNLNPHQRISNCTVIKLEVTKFMWAHYITLSCQIEIFNEERYFLILIWQTTKLQIQGDIKLEKLKLIVKSLSVLKYQNQIKLKHNFSLDKELRNTLLLPSSTL